MRQESNGSCAIITPKIIGTKKVDFNEISAQVSSVYDIGIEYRVWVPSAEIETFFLLGFIDRTSVSRLGLKLSGIW